LDIRGFTSRPVTFSDFNTGERQRKADHVKKEHY
jgi:hypothetical protein